MMSKLLASLLALCFIACVPKNLSVDFGVDIGRTPTSTVGVSHPLVKEVYLSAGVWATTDGYWGPYLSLGYSWSPFAK